jgi:hypothetical protein
LDRFAHLRELRDGGGPRLLDRGLEFFSWDISDTDGLDLLMFRDAGALGDFPLRQLSMGALTKWLISARCMGIARLRRVKRRVPPFALTFT